MQRQCTTHKLLASAQRGAGTYNSDPWLKVGSFIEGLLMVLVTAESGTATLNITVQTSPDGGTTVITHTTLTEISEVSTLGVIEKLTHLGEWIRVSAVVAGSDTPKFTFSIHLAVKT